MNRFAVSEAPCGDHHLFLPTAAFADSYSAFITGTILDECAHLTSSIGAPLTITMN
jgi:hypothetical protein